MWYAFIDGQRRLARTIASQIQCGEVWSTATAASATGPGVAVSAFRHWLLRSTCAYRHAPSFGIRVVAHSGNGIDITETVVDSVPTGTLRKFTRTGTARQDHTWPVMLCAPLAGHHAVMLRETVETLLEERDVFVSDWADARDVPNEAGPLSLDDYVLALERFMDSASACGPPIHVVAVCQATVPALAAAALLASVRTVPFASLSLIGGPIDTRISPTVIDRFAASHTLTWFREHVIDVVPPPYRGAGRRVYPGFIQHGALLSAHPERHVRLESAYWSNWLAGDMRAAGEALRSLNEYAAVLDMAERYFLDILRIVFQEHLLPRNTWWVQGRRVEPKALCRTPLCTVEGELDDITGAGQTHCAHTLCGASSSPRDGQITVPACNHYDLFTGPRWRDVVHPALCSFWRDVEDAASSMPVRQDKDRPTRRRRHA
ncbi:polyhydroxyalkanoate depolymerase [Paraburkholderia phymatum]|uniref:Polyhydroxyalkanoate depolymerase, intracellular n=1 Tax=Paraburkholderia phymatum (strain DSM 17167 / CIP 108236 / LMG 21445 / STM815) TaxID=391038 RepID=B2JH65_PARP8|nr:polyhydroxyalkanoate depolymerase [Paraburkholderia phymatum]ACC70303.1 polyhydroxyalkanoate depolymerase, intracellular [Paraburkholderia phymatum STM815]